MGAKLCKFVMIPATLRKAKWEALIVSGADILGGGGHGEKEWGGRELKERNPGDHKEVRGSVRKNLKVNRSDLET